MSWISGRRLLAQVLLISGGFFLAAPAWSQERANKPQEGGFVEGRSGVVPEGAAELVTPATDAAIEKGLAWLSTQQNADGSFGSGAYRGNVAVTSLAAISFMASGSSPNRGPYGKGLAVRSRQYQSIGLCLCGQCGHPRPHVLAWVRHVVPGRGLWNDASS